MPPTLTAPLADRLRLETRDLHAAAERSGVMVELLQGRLPLHRYRAMLRNLHTIYAALERALDARRSDPRVAPLRFPDLYRAQSLASDLQDLAGPGANDDAVDEEAATAYAGRLAHIARCRSPALVAHAYVRYLGDLHGGQLLKRAVERAYGRDGGQIGTRFYEFGSDDVQLLRHDFRLALASVPATPDESDLIVTEARWAYAQHQRLFEQLLARQPG